MPTSRRKGLLFFFHLHVAVHAIAGKRTAFYGNVAVDIVTGERRGRIGFDGDIPVYVGTGNQTALDDDIAADLVAFERGGFSYVSDDGNIAVDIAARNGTVCDIDRTAHVTASKRGCMLRRGAK